MKKLNGIIAAGIAVTLMIGISPVSAVKADKGQRKVQLLTCSDYQRWYPDGQYNKDDLDYLKKQFTDIAHSAYNAGLTSPDYLLFGGDTSCLHDAKSSDEGQRQFMEVVNDCWQNITYENSLILQGNHDPADTSNIPESGAYEYDEFIVYMLNEDDYPTKQGEEAVHDVVVESADKLGEYLDGCIARKEGRPIIIASHGGLHYDIDRTDGNNQYAYELFNVVNEKALYLDIIFMFGHNHTNGDELVGGSITFFKKGDELPVCHEDSIANRSGTKTELNFTYMNYGYIGYIGDIHNNPSELEVTDKLVVSSITIYDDTIEVSRYSKNGWESKYDGTIVREHTPQPAPSPSPAATPVQNQSAASTTSATQNQPAASAAQNQTSGSPEQTPASSAATGSTAKSDKLTLSSVKCRKNTKKITGSVSVKGAAVRVKIGSKKYLNARVNGKKFILKLKYKLKKNTNVKIKVSKKGCKTVTCQYKIK